MSAAVSPSPQRPLYASGRLTNGQFGISKGLSLVNTWRLEALTKQLGKTVLLSPAFADLVESGFGLERVGEYPVRGFSEAIELFAYNG